LTHLTYVTGAKQAGGLAVSAHYSQGPL